MPCNLINIDSGADCNNSNGGVRVTLYTKLSNITTATLTSDVISNFTMSSTGLWKKLNFEKDGTAFFNVVGTRNGDRITFEQSSLLKFKGLTETYLKAANELKDCCELVMVHFLNNGATVVQGLERISATGSPIGLMNTQNRLVPSAYSDTSQNSSRLEFNISGNGNSMPMTTSMTEAAILAL